MKLYKGDKCVELTCGNPNYALLAKPITIESTRDMTTAESIQTESDMFGFVRAPLVKMVQLQDRPWYNHLRALWDTLKP